MNRIIIAFFLNLFPIVLSAQEFNCNVTVSAPTIQLTNKQVFTSMENTIRDFMNSRRWTNDVYQPFERIECAILITVTGVNGNDYSSTIQVQASRPVYGSNYKTSTFSFYDKSFNFTYIENQPIEYQEGVYLNEMGAILGYYANMMLGFDYDAFSENGGSAFFQRALSIVNAAQASGNPGWNNQDKNEKNRYFFINEILSDRNRDFHKAWYIYHRLGLDIMSQDNQKGRDALLTSLHLLYNIYKSNGGLVIMNRFFNMKAQELSDIFAEATTTQKEDARKLLTEMDVNNANKLYNW